MGENTMLAIACALLIAEKVSQFVGESVDIYGKVVQTVFCVYEINLPNIYHPNDYWGGNSEVWWASQNLPNYCSFRHEYVEYLPYRVDHRELIQKQAKIRLEAHPDHKVYQIKIPEFSSEEDHIETVSVGSSDLAVSFIRNYNSGGPILMVIHLQKKEDFTDEEFLEQCNCFIPQYFVFQLRQR